MIQIRDPKTDGDDQWEVCHTTDPEAAAASFRKLRSLPVGWPVEVMNGDGVAQVLPRPNPRPGQPKRVEQPKGSGRRGVSRAAIRRHLREQGLTANELLAAEFGAEALAQFLQMRAMINEIYAMARPAFPGDTAPPELIKDGERYFLTQTEPT